MLFIQPVQSHDYAGSSNEPGNITSLARNGLQDGGYVDATVLSNPKTYGFTPNYYNKDHLGNNREVVNSSSNVRQLTNYYPFGAPYADPAAVIGSTIQPYKYNGKELDTMHGLNTYDYGARQYYSIIGRWDRMDPLCEKYYDVSPYAYCMNNPVKYIDKEGGETVLYATTLPGISIPYATHTFIVVYQPNKNPQYFAYGPTSWLFGKLERSFYEQDMNIINGRDMEHLKNRIIITPPQGMSEADFDKRVIDTANSFGNDDDFSYSIFPTKESEGNCNTSSSTILYKSGVPIEQLYEYGNEIKGCSYGFGNIKAWTKEEQRNAVQEQHDEDIKFQEYLNWFH